MGPTHHNNPNVSVFVSGGAGPASSLHRQATWARRTEVCWEGRVNHTNGSNQQPGVAMSTDQSIPRVISIRAITQVLQHSQPGHTRCYSHTHEQIGGERGKGGGQEDSGSGGCYREEETEVQQNEPNSLYPSFFFEHTPHLALQLGAHAPCPNTHTRTQGLFIIYLVHSC